MLEREGEKTQNTSHEPTKITMPPVRHERAQKKVIVNIKIDR